MCVREEGPPELGHPVGAEAERDAGQAQRPLRAAGAIEDRSAQAPAALDDQTGVDRVSPFLGLGETCPKGR